MQTLQQLPEAAAILSSLNSQGSMRVLEMVANKQDNQLSHVQICFSGLRGVDIDLWAAERSDPSSLRIYLAGNMLWFGALASTTKQICFLRIEMPHGQFLYSSQQQCRLKLSIGKDCAGAHAWADEERHRLRVLATQSLLAPLMQQIDHLGSEPLAIGFKNSLQTFHPSRSAALYASLVPLLLDGWIETTRRQRTGKLIDTVRREES